LDIFFISYIPYLSGCSSLVDKSYLTPIPEETIQAYSSGSPINNKLDAVIAARFFLQKSFHFYCINSPDILLVEKMTLMEATERIERPGSDTYHDRPDNTKVWLVLFECDWVVDFDSFEQDVATPTPEPPFTGCGFVILDSSNGAGFRLGTTECPYKYNKSGRTIYLPTTAPNLTPIPTKPKTDPGIYPPHITKAPEEYP
jgi:hypothetical protein